MLLVGINAKYVHSNLAIRYLSKLERRCCFREYTIQERPEAIAADLYQSGARCFLFSCYIWNIGHVLQICDILKKADAGLHLALGGPEVSFDPEQRLLDSPFVDFILCGEGEPSVTPFADALETAAFEQVPGLYYRKNGMPASSGVPCREADLAALPFPYEAADMPALRGRLVYYETSRGCPYRCSFCLSGAAGSLRFLPVERVERELCFFEQQGVPLVKLVDRTFNADSARALAIIEGIKQRGGNTAYHFEIRAESMTEALIQSLQTAPPGMFQLEIGVQSANHDTLQAVCRKPDFERLAQVVRELSRNGNIHLHLDLIAGLPGETLPMFIDSFCRVMALRPQKLQLGFLKRLKGAALTASGSAFCEHPPYEIIHSDAMSYSELLKLKQAEEMLERYYNSGAFAATVTYLLDMHYRGREFALFAGLAEFIGTSAAPKSHKAVYEDLYRFIQPLGDVQLESRLIYDYCLRHRDSLSFMRNGDGLKERAFAFLKRPERVSLYFADYAGEKPVLLYKKIRFVPIGTHVIAFDYAGGRTADVTKEFELEE